jgi:hypothetical protein
MLTLHSQRDDRLKLHPRAMCFVLPSDEVPFGRLRAVLQKCLMLSVRNRKYRLIAGVVDTFLLLFESWILFYSHVHFHSQAGEAKRGKARQSEAKRGIKIHE